MSATPTTCATTPEPTPLPTPRPTTTPTLTPTQTPTPTSTPTPTPTPTTGTPTSGPPTRLILIEGLPGSGKTTAAEYVARRLRAHGVPARWYREELAAHPVIDRAVRRTAREPGYADRCLARWQAFARATRDAAHVSVLEGCFLQSTVRCMLEHEAPETDPARYAAGVARALRPLDPWLVHLVHDEPRVHLAERLAARKTGAYVDRIAAYTETTACARRHGWTGRRALIEFYDRYAATCRALVAATPWPRIELDAGGDDWEAVRRPLAAWLAVTGLADPAAKPDASR